MARTEYTALKLYGRLLLQARAYWSHIAGLFLLNLLHTPLSLLKPLALMIAVDSVVGRNPLPKFLDALVPRWVTGSPLRLLVLAAVLQVLVVLLVQLDSLATYLLRTEASERMTLDFRSALFRHLQRLSLTFHDRHGTADSIYRVQDDAPAIKWITIDGVLPLVSDAFALVAMIYVIFRLDWQLALVSLAVSPVLVLCARSYDQRVSGRYKGVKELESAALDVVQEVLSAVRVVKAFGREESEQERFVRHSSQGVQARIRLAFAESAFGVFIGVTTAMGMAMVLFLGIRSVQAGTLKLGQLVVVLTYLAEMYAPLETISTQFATLQGSLASAERAFEILDEVPEVVERPDAKPVERAAGAVEFRNVCFGYDGRNTVLSDVCFVVPAGTRVGIAGRTGVGKTTLLSLLIRFYDPISGQILLDGEDLRDYRLVDLRNQFALVLQEPVLFSTTISENIAYARPDATEREIIEAAKAANAHEFILGLPDGYRTEVGERGMMVSGGERQRISLARAFLKDAPILILDEPTSAVDVKTEAAIIEAMERLMRGRTSFLISHRLSALKNCDMLVKIEHGHPVESTTPGPRAVAEALALAAGDPAKRTA
ncbi:MAG TPA: ABC transporter ATP-binding protein [Ktedonobacterales bacterium]|nr:ABC transporter ATP-binding protein [Ktedonobacterales bacterium]